MSRPFDKRKTIKLTPANAVAVDAKVEKLNKKRATVVRILVSRAKVANQAIAIGIKHL